MKIGRAIRLRALWNASFGFKLRIKNYTFSENSLWVPKNEIDAVSQKMLKRLVDVLNLKLEDRVDIFWIS